MEPLLQSQATIERFIDALWIEDGLAANTLAAYRRDLTLFAHWLARGAGRREWLLTQTHRLVARSGDFALYEHRSLPSPDPCLGP